jgi:hypothetical protein
MITAFTVIDFPGAVARFVSRINARDQIVGADSDDDPNFPALELPHGFVLDTTSMSWDRMAFCGADTFTTISAPG